MQRLLTTGPKALLPGALGLVLIFALGYKGPQARGQDEDLRGSQRNPLKFLGGFQVIDFKKTKDSFDQLTVYDEDPPGEGEDAPGEGPYKVKRYFWDKKCPGLGRCPPDYVPHKKPPKTIKTGNYTVANGILKVPGWGKYRILTNPTNDGYYILEKIVPSPERPSPRR